MALTVESLLRIPRVAASALGCVSFFVERLKFVKSGNECLNLWFRRERRRRESHRDISPARRYGIQVQRHALNHVGDRVRRSGVAKPIYLEDRILRDLSLCSGQARPGSDCRRKACGFCGEPERITVIGDLDDRRVRGITNRSLSRIVQPGSRCSVARETLDFPDVGLGELRHLDGVDARFCRTRRRRSQHTRSRERRLDRREIGRRLQTGKRITYGTQLGLKLTERTDLDVSRTDLRFELGERAALNLHQLTDDASNVDFAVGDRRGTDWRSRHAKLPALRRAG